VTSTSFRRRLLLAVLAGVFVISLLFAAGASASPIAQKKARLKAVQARLQTAYTQAEIATEKYNQASAQLDTVNEKIHQNQRLLDAAEHDLRTANKQLKARARNIYKARDVGVVDVLFAADSFDELITQLDMMNRLGNSDVDTVKAIAKYRRNIKDRRVRLRADKKQAALLVVERAAEKDRIASLEADLESMTRGLKKQIKKMQAQAALRAKLALQGYNGPIPNVDPNSPGHPEIVAIAQRYFGVPYVWGGAGTGGFDCSGLTMYCYAQIGIQLSHGATDQQRASVPVPLSDLRPGDLIFFGNASFSHHVAIFVGGTTCIEAPHTGDVVRYGTFTGRDAWIGGRF
jgi:peptidoglycan hydrolase CwlO-like protein